MGSRFKARLAPRPSYLRWVGIMRGGQRDRQMISAYISFEKWTEPHKTLPHVFLEEPAMEGGEEESWKEGEEICTCM